MCACTCDIAASPHAQLPTSDPHLSFWVIPFGAVTSVADHPLVPFLRAGVNVGVNTDTRLMSDVSPTGEMWALHNECGIDWTEIGRLVENAIASSFAPVETRRRLLDEVVRPAYTSLAEA